VARSGLVAPAIVSLVPFPGEESDLAFSPDGRYLVFSAMGETQNNRDIYVSEVATKKKVGQGAIWRVTTHPHKDTQPVWSPDGQRIAFLRSADKFGEPYKLIITSVRGEDEQEVGQVTGGLSWSPDGKYLAVSASPGVGRPTSLYLLSPRWKGIPCPWRSPRMGTESLPGARTSWSMSGRSKPATRSSPSRATRTG